MAGGGERVVTIHGTKMLAHALAASNGGAFGVRTWSEQAPQARVYDRRQSVCSLPYIPLGGTFCKTKGNFNLILMYCVIHATHGGCEMTYLEYQARQFVDTWYCLIDMERAKLMSPLLRDRLQAVIAQTWAEEGRGVDGEL